MLPRIDHVILHVHDLAAASRDMAAAGFVVQRRADRASKGGASYRFVTFADGSYILLTAFTPAGASAHRLSAILAEGEGWAEYGVVVPNLDAAIAAGRDAGIVLGAVHDVRNVVASGDAWALRLLVAGRGAGGDDALPFLVEDVTGRAARIPPPVDHPNGARGIAGLTVASADPGRTARALAALTGAEITPATGGLAMDGASLRFIATDAAGTGTARLGGLTRVAIGAGRDTGIDPSLCHGGPMAFVA
jgi:hypothetical protein